MPFLINAQNFFHVFQKNCSLQFVFLTDYIKRYPKNVLPMNNKQNNVHVA